MARRKPLPSTEELTARQNAKQPGRPLNLFVVSGRDSAKPPVGSFATYEKMSRNPTIALARMIATMPCRAAKWHVDADEDANPDAVEYVETITKALWPDWVSHACQALDYGFQSWEVIWKDDGGQWVPDRLKPLSPHMTEIMVEKDHGNFTGLKQDDLILPLENSLLYSYNARPGNLYGQSRHENCRETAWAEWESLFKKLAKYTKRVAGAVPRLGYPEGESTDNSGAKRSHMDIARAAIEALENGDAIAYPNLLNAENAMALVRAGAKDLGGLALWQWDFLESRDSHGEEFKSLLTYSDQLMMRAWLVPERAATEAQTGGSRADSESHGDVAEDAGSLVLEDMLSAWNRGLVDRALELNFGKEVSGTIRVIRIPLTAEKKQFYQTLLHDVLVQPPNIDLLLKAVDTEQLLKDADLPIKKGAGELTSEDVVPGAAPSEAPPAAMSMAREVYNRMGKKVKAKGA